MPKTVETINPANGQKLASYNLNSLEEAIGAAKHAHDAYESNWSLLSVGDRAGLLKELAKSIRSKKNAYAKIMTEEMGKPITQSEAEVEKCAWAAEVYANNSEKWLEDEIAETDAKKSYVTFEPIGTILSIMPWNFPFWQALRFAIPTLVAGNTSILRHSNVCPGSAFAIEESFRNAGFPEGVFTTVVTDHDTVTKLVESKWINGVSLTGSSEAGTLVGEVAARNLKKFVLELGGSDPFIVVDDANVKSAAEVGVNARLLNSGQSCICAKRFIITQTVAKEFIESFVTEIERKKVGDPMDPKTDVGPLCNKNQVETVDSQVKESLSKGAKALAGATKMDGPGAFYAPTVLSDVNLGMQVMIDEVFGPVAPLYVVANEEEAIRVANLSEFGLGASLWTTDPLRAKRLVPRIESGMVFVNSLVKSDPRMPFGGIKKSGVGRELSKFGLREFVNIKSVNVYGMDAF